MREQMLTPAMLKNTGKNLKTHYFTKYGLSPSITKTLIRFSHAPKIHYFSRYIPKNVKFLNTDLETHQTYVILRNEQNSR